MLEVVILAGAYVIGSIPFGLLLTRLAGYGDIRDIGSGNIGATNVMRTGRRGLAVLTLLLDVGKGVLALWLVQQLTPNMVPYAAILVVIGHCFPIWLQFKGGKGVATSLGVLAMLSTPVAILTVSVWLLIFIFYRISSVAALVSALLAPFFAYALADNHTLWVMLVLSVLLVTRHVSNIQRLIAGEERKIAPPPSKTSTSPASEHTPAEETESGPESVSEDERR